MAYLSLRRHLFKLPTFRQSLHFADKAGGDKSDAAKKPDPKKPPAQPQTPSKPLKMTVIPYREVHIDEDRYTFRRHLLKLPKISRSTLYFADKAGSGKGKEDTSKTTVKPVKSTPMLPEKKVKLVIVPYNDIHRDEDYFEYNERLGRFYSPHMTIYEPQLTSILSFVHRIAGTAISGYFSILGLSAFVLPYDMLDSVTYLQDQIQNLQIPGVVLLVIKVILTLPFTFHLFNGIRHLVWDSGRCLNMPEVYKTGYVAVAAAVILCGVLTIM